MKREHEKARALIADLATNAPANLMQFIPVRVVVLEGLFPEQQEPLRAHLAMLQKTLAVVPGYQTVVPYDIYSHWYDTIFLPSLNEPQP